MKIVRSGSLIKERTCVKCGCVFMYNHKKDVHEEWDGSGRLLYTYVDCPECDHRIILEI